MDFSGTKECPKCNATKRVSEFAKNRSASDGYAAYCRLCMHGYHVKKYKRHPKKKVQYEEDRVCVNCGTLKSPVEFGYQNKALGTRKAICRQCRSPYGPSNPKPKIFIDGHRKCSECKQWMPFDTFQISQRGNPTSKCKRCRSVLYSRSAMKPELLQKLHKRERDYGLKKKYGITHKEFLVMSEAQNGACAICGRVTSYHLHVDHDHRTGRVRGLLCRQCNQMLGFAKDESDTLIRAARYLESHECQDCE